uniref:Odorant receptor n=1 Tax=Adelphocoris lineolatus TaxID=236346 RepID=A0A2I4PH53_ADELI|nr:olfactory receptor 58 [Adelphocoris lineolatus]
MWDWIQLRMFNLWGWWPKVIKDPRKRVMMRIYGYCMFGLDSATMIAEFVSLYLAVVNGSFRGAIVNIVTTTLGATAAMKIYTLLVHHEFISHICNTLEDLNNRAIALMGEESQVTMGTRKRNCKLTFVFVGSCLFTVCHYNVRPILVYTLYGERTIAMDMWTPWDEQTSLSGWVIVLIYEWIHIAAAMYGMVVFDSFVLCIFEMVLAEFDVLKIALKKVDFAAEKNAVPIEFCIQFHQDLLVLIAKINDFLIPIQTFQCIMLTLTICFSGFELVSLSDVSMNKAANLLEVLGASTYITFGYCYQCHCITEECVEVITTACDNNWFEGSIKDQKSLSILLERAKNPISFGNIIKFDLGCFIAIIKTAFSYYQVLEAFDIH